VSAADQRDTMGQRDDYKNDKLTYRDSSKDDVVVSFAATVNSSMVPAAATPLSLLDVAASVTQESCLLLGVKSLGVDYGLVRTGLAVTVGYEPKALAIIDTSTLVVNNNSNTTTTTTMQQQFVCEQIIRYASTENVQRIIVGLPLHKNGTVAEQTNLTLAFGRNLQRHVVSQFGRTVPMVFFDERYTSKAAAARAQHNPAISSHTTADAAASLYGTLDADAACILLESYYSENGVGAHEYKLLTDDEFAECLAVYKERQFVLQRNRQAVLEEREPKLRRRKESIARDALLQEIDEDPAIRKRKKKRRKKR